MFTQTSGIGFRFHNRTDGCGRVSVPHDGHTDYLHDEHVHHAHDDHYDECASSEHVIAEDHDHVHRDGCGHPPCCTATTLTTCTTATGMPHTADSTTSTDPVPTDLTRRSAAAAPR
ncbi:hypothetical protein [Micromonospora sp. AB353]|uniref:hypothetical protein n=1 Tax=Micromonospora sp. AB353 TaxID=3413282 RepID=UPI003C20B1FD